MTFLYDIFECILIFIVLKPWLYHSRRKCYARIVKRLFLKYYFGRKVDIFMFNLVITTRDKQIYELKNQINFIQNIAYYGRNVTRNTIHQRDMLQAVEQALQNVCWINRILTNLKCIFMIWFKWLCEYFILYNILILLFARINIKWYKLLV